MLPAGQGNRDPPRLPGLLGVLQGAACTREGPRRRSVRPAQMLTSSCRPQAFPGTNPASFPHGDFGLPWGSELLAVHVFSGVCRVGGAPDRPLVSSKGR